MVVVNFLITMAVGYALGRFLVEPAVKRIIKR
jgi:hypothetical protein